MHIREALPSDSEAIRLIYNYEVLNSVSTLDLIPRSKEAQAEWMSEHSGIHAAIVVEIDKEVVAFASISPYRPRPGYSSTVENSIYVHQNYRGQKIGSSLLGALVDTAKDLGFHSCMARVVATQSASIELHRKCGFNLVGIEREVGRKFGQWIDVALMQRML